MAPTAPTAVAPLRTTSVSATSNTPLSTSSTAVASSSRKTAPIYVSPTWQASPVASSSSSESKKPTSSRTTYSSANNTVSSTWQAGPVASSSLSESKKPASSRTTYGNANITANTYVTGGNDVNCDCSIPAIQKTVTDGSASKGRKFWNCPNTVCEFFQWVEDAPVASGSSVPAKRPYPPVGRFLYQICPILSYRLCIRRVETQPQTSSCACVNATKKASY